MAYLEFFSDELLNLQYEILHHPDVCQDINPEDDLSIKLGKIAARLDIILDGDYMVNNVCAMLTKKLYERRTSIILPLQ